MLVNFDHQVFSSQQYGGISRYFVELARNLTLESRNKIEIKIIAPFYKNKYLHQSRKKLNLNGVFIPDIPKTGKLLRCFNDFGSPFLQKLASPDIIHETYYSPKTIGSKKPIRVITVHDMIHEIFPDNFSKKDPTIDFKKNAISRADHLICVSENTRNDLINILGVKRDKTSVVHHGFALTASQSKIMTLKSKPFLLYVGSRGGYKNFYRFVEAYAASSVLLKEFDLLCFGGGGFRQHEINLFKELKISPDKIYHVAGDDDSLANYYKNASLFIYPSLYEGFGIPPLEAMSYGCPVICSNTSSIPEVVGEAAIFFDPYSIESIQEAMEEILFDSSSRSLVIKRGYDRINNFSWEKCARETLNIYQGLLT